jgi:hypothetical protein
MDAPHAELNRREDVFLSLDKIPYGYSHLE